MRLSTHSYLSQRQVTQSCCSLHCCVTEICCRNCILSEPLLHCPILLHALFPGGFKLICRMRKEPSGQPGGCRKLPPQQGAAGPAAEPTFSSWELAKSLHSWWEWAKTTGHTIMCHLGCYLPAWQAFFKTRLQFTAHCQEPSGNISMQSLSIPRFCTPLLVK